LFLLLGLVTYHFVTFGVHFLLKMTHSNTKNDPSNVTLIVYSSIEVCVQLQKTDKNDFVVK